MNARQVETDHCRIAIDDSMGEGLPVLLIHGNSSCKEVFRNQMQGEIGRYFRCIAMDLPGHGASADARDPARTYSMPGYADTASQVMQALGFNQYAVLGWSLGGHIGIEMMATLDRMRGLMISGTPPVKMGEEAVAAGFLPSEHMHLAGQNEFSEAEIDAYSRATCGINAPFEPFLRDAVARTDGQARELMFQSFLAGNICNQHDVATGAKIPLAIVNGGGEPFVNNDYVASLAYENLWEDEVFLLNGIGHAPFWEAPDQFNPIAMRFLRSL